jgi:hypothetical protein
MNPLATAETLFRAYLLPLYPEAAARDLALARATDANPGHNPSFARHLDDASRVFAERAPSLLGKPVALDYSDASVHRLSALVTRDRRDSWASHGAAGSGENELFNVVVHGAAYVGACVVRSHAGEWRVRNPLWESFVHLRSRAGEADLAVLQWWVKTLSDESFDRGITLADRYRAYVENPCATPESLPILAPPDRRLPRLAKPSYDMLHKYLRAHLPEMRDLGEHFPSPERWADFAFSWVDFALVGEGRMLVMSAPNAHGLHLIWLTSSGFDKSVFHPCDSFPEPQVRLDERSIRAILSVDGKTVVHETLWWGP